jgi:hypothetical protein
MREIVPTGPPQPRDERAQPANGYKNSERAPIRRSLDGVKPDRRTAARTRVDLLKGRIAEALVEAMFRRAGYAVSRSGRESQVQRLFKLGADQFLPDFTIRKPVKLPDSDRPLHQFVHIEVKYRADIPRFLKLHAAALFEHAKDWPDLYVILVTDKPECERSWFQVLTGNADAPNTCDVHEVRDLNIYASTVIEFQELGTKLFTLMAEHRATIGTIANP